MPWRHSRSIDEVPLGINDWRVGVSTVESMEVNACRMWLSGLHFSWQKQNSQRVRFSQQQNLWVELCDYDLWISPHHWSTCFTKKLHGFRRFQHVGIGCSDPRRGETQSSHSKPTSISCRSRGDPSNRRGTKRSWVKRDGCNCSLHLKGNTCNILELGKEIPFVLDCWWVIFDVQVQLFGVSTFSQARLVDLVGWWWKNHFGHIPSIEISHFI